MVIKYSFTPEEFSKINQNGPNSLIVVYNFGITRPDYLLQKIRESGMNGSYLFAVAGNYFLFVHGSIFPEIRKLIEQYDEMCYRNLKGQVVGLVPYEPREPTQVLVDLSTEVSVQGDSR